MSKVDVKIVKTILKTRKQYLTLKRLREKEVRNTDKAHISSKFH